MKLKLSDKQAFSVCVLIVLTVLVVGLAILKCYALFTYADTPMSDVPLWVHWLLSD